MSAFQHAYFATLLAIVFLVVALSSVWAVMDLACGHDANREWWANLLRTPKESAVPATLDFALAFGVSWALLS
jgi:hypothetical protein